MINVITITGIGDHLQPVWLITFTGMRSNLEYLFGFVTADDGQPRFAALWTHDREAEKRAFEDAVDFITARLSKHPDAFVYH